MVAAQNDYTPRHSADRDEDDLITAEQTDDAAVDMGVSHAELRDGLDRLDGHDPDVLPSNQQEGADDMREAIEDADEQENKE